MKDLLYVRVSSMEQVTDGNSLISQERILMDLSVKRGHEPILFREEGESAKTTNRTKLRQMMEYAAKNKKDIGTLLVYKVDRLARQTNDYLTLKLYFNSLGIKVESATERIEDSPIGRFTETVLAGSAQFDNEMRAANCKGGMEQAVREGRYVWMAPIGYVNTKVKDKSNIAPSSNVELVKKVREIWVNIDAGMSPEQSRQTVNNTGLKEFWGREIGKSHFYELLENPLYKGVVKKFGLEVLSKDIVPIVEPDLFDRVWAKLHSKNRPIVRYQKLNPLFPLRGLIECKEGHHITGSVSSGNGGDYPHYHCIHCRGKNSYYSADDVHIRFRNKLGTLCYDDNYKELLKIAINENWEERNSQNQKVVLSLEKKVMELEAKKRQIADKNFKGVLNDTDARDMIDETNLNITNAKIDLQQLNESDENIQEIADFGVGVLATLDEVWDEIKDLGVRYRFQKFVFPSGIVYDGKEIMTAKIPLCLRIKDEALLKNSAEVDHGGVGPPFPQCECGALPDKLMAQVFYFFDYFINSFVNYHFFFGGKWF